MSRLIEFIFENIVYVVIVLGFVSSLFSKWKKAQGDTSNPPQGQNRMPSFGGGETTKGPLQWPSANRTPIEQPIKRVQPMQDEQPANKLTSPVPNDYAYNAESNQDYSMVATQPGQTFEANCSRQAGISQREIVQGMIWSEILAQPRAKRPFVFRK